MDVVQNFLSRYEKTREEELTLEEYLELCKRDKLAYATAAERVGNFQMNEREFLRKQRLVFDQRRRLIVKIFNRRAAVRRFASRVGHAIDVIESKFFGDAELAFDEHAIIHRIIAIFCADQISGELHRDRHQRQAIDGTMVQVCQNAFASVQGETPFLITH